MRHAEDPACRRVEEEYHCSFFVTVTLAIFGCAIFLVGYTTQKQTKKSTLRDILPFTVIDGLRKTVRHRGLQRANWRLGAEDLYGKHPSGGLYIHY